MECRWISEFSALSVEQRKQFSLWVVILNAKVDNLTLSILLST